MDQLFSDARKTADTLNLGRFSLLIPVLGITFWLLTGVFLLFMRQQSVQEARNQVSLTIASQTAALVAELSPRLDSSLSPERGVETVLTTLMREEPAYRNLRAAVIRPDGTARFISSPASSERADDATLNFFLAQTRLVATPGRKACVVPLPEEMLAPGALNAACEYRLTNLGGLGVMVTGRYPVPYPYSAEARWRFLSTILCLLLTGSLWAWTLFRDRSSRKSMESMRAAILLAADRAADRNQEHAAIYHSMQEGALILQDGVIVSCTPVFAYLVGQEPETVAAQDYRSYIVPEDLPTLEGSLASVFASDRPLPRFSLRLTTGFGDQRWVSCTLTRIRWQGRDAALLCALDITALEHAEKEKVLAKTQLQGLLDACPVGAAVFDPYGSLVRANASWNRHWGDPSHGGLKRITVAEESLFPKPVSDALAKAYGGERVSLSTQEYQSPWGERFLFSYTFLPLRGAGDATVGVIMLQEDVSRGEEHVRREMELGDEVTRANYELLRLRDHMSAFLDATPSALVGVDEDMRVTTWNSAAEKRFSLPRETALGRRIKDMPPSVARHYPVIRKALFENTVFQAARMPYANGQDVTYEDIVVFPVTTNISRTVIVRMDEVSRPVYEGGDLVADRQVALPADLLRAIMDELSLLEKGQMPAPADSVAVLRGYFCRLTSLVAGLLPAVHLPGEAKTSTDCNLLLQRAVNLAENEAGLRIGQGVLCLTARYGSDIQPVRCFAGDIVHVILQLIRALVYLHPAGTREIHINLATKSSHSTVSLTLAAPGILLSGQTCRDIFNPFLPTFPEDAAQMDANLSLALAMVAENHGGFIRCDSHESTGTVFTLTLPSDSEPAP